MPLAVFPKCFLEALCFTHTPGNPEIRDSRD